MKKSRAIITFCLFFLVVVISAGAFIYMHSLIGKKNETIAGIQVEIANERGAQASFAEVKRVLKETESSRKAIDSFYVREDEVVTFIESIESLGQAAGVAVEISHATPEEIKGAKELALSLVAVGDYAAIQHFLLLLENMPHEILINKVALNAEIEPARYTTDQTGKVTGTVPSKTKGWRGTIDFTLISYH